MEQISFACGVILCVIGVLTFIVGMTQRAKSDGVMMQKLNQTVDGIEDLKTDVKDIKNHQHKSELKIQSQEEQIKTLFTMVNNNEHTDQALVTIMQVLNTHLIGGDSNVKGTNQP